MEKTPNLIESSLKENIKIKIQTMDSVFQVEVGDEDLISDLKTKISTQYKIPITHQRLIYQGKLLQDSEKLSFYKIMNDCVVHLVARALEENVNSINVNNNQNQGQNQNQLSSNPNQQQQEIGYEEIVPVLQIPFRSNRRRRFLMPHYDVSECFEAIYQNMISIDNLQKCQVPFKGKSQTIEPFDLSKTTYEVGQWVDVKDTIEQWLEAQVIQLRNNSQAFVHYNGWGTRWDEWIDFSSNRMRNFKTYTLQPPASAYMSPYPGIPCDSNIEPQQRSIDAFYFLEKCKEYIDNISAKFDLMLSLRHKNKEIFEHNYLNVNDQEILFNATQMIPLMDRAGRMMEDISMLMSHLVVNPNLYPQMLLGYKKNELFNKINIEALKKCKESQAKTSFNPYFEEVIPHDNESRSAQLSPRRMNANENINMNPNTTNSMQEQISSSIAELEENLQQLHQQYTTQLNNSNGSNTNNINGNSHSSNTHNNNTNNINNNSNTNHIISNSNISQNSNGIRSHQIVQVSHTQPQSPNHIHNNNNNNSQASIQTSLGYNLTSSSNELPFIQRILSSFTQSDRILNPSSHVSNLRDKEAFFPKINLQSPSLLSPGEVMMMTGYYPYSDQNFDIYLHTIVSHPPNGNGNNNNSSINPNNNGNNNNPININNDNNDHGLNNIEINQTNNEINERRISQPTPHLSQRINDMLGMSLSDTIFGNQIGNGTNMNEVNNSQTNNNPFRSENQLYKDEMTQTSFDLSDDKSDSYHSALSKD